MVAYYIRTADGRVQGPYDDERVRRYIAIGRVEERAAAKDTTRQP